MKYSSIERVWPTILWRGDSPRRILINRAWASRFAWSLRSGWLRSGHRKSRTLFAGPWVGEFGWELMNWQGFIRALRPYYEHITVCAREPSAALYDDCCDEFISHNIQGQPNAHVIFDVKNPDELWRVLDLVPAQSDHLKPLRHVPIEAQDFIRYGGAQTITDTPDILVHARGNPLTADRNWSKDKWNDLICRLYRAGFKVGQIGISGSTIELEGADDYRDRPLDETMSRIATAQIVIGPSSGPMHLASLCGTPHLVWTDRRTYSMRRHSRDLYETCWNPLETPAIVVDEYGFDPPVDFIYRTCIEFLCRNKGL